MEKNTASRREFLQACGVLGLGLAAGGVVPLAAEAAKFNRSAYRAFETRLLMGTFVSMTVLHESRALAEEAKGRAFEEIIRLCGVFNRYDDATPVSVLNREGRITGAPPELAEVMDRALRFHSLSDHAFDVTVAPLVDLFQKKSKAGEKLELSGKEFEEALRLVDSGAVELAPGKISLKKSGMRVTLDGIAKGYIVDRASDVLSRHGALNHLINAGGDIRTRGERSGHRPWTVAVEDPEKRGNYPDVISMRDGAIATSGGYEVYFDREKMFHHVVSPATGRSPIRAAGVSVLAPNVMEADALSTSVFVMPPKQGIAFVNSLPGRECLIVADTGAQIKSRNWGRPS